MRARQFIQWENEYKCFGQCWVFVVQNASLLSVVSCTENGAWRRSHLELRPFLFTSFASFPALNRGRIFLLRFPLCNFLFGKNLCQLHHQDWINQIFPKFIYIYIWLVLLSFSSLGRWVAIDFTQGANYYYSSSTSPLKQYCASMNQLGSFLFFVPVEY